MAWKCYSPDYGTRPARPTVRPARLNATTDRAAHCVGCGTELMPEWKACPMCGKQAASVSRVENATYTCGGCGKPIERTWKFCPCCSHAISFPPEVVACSCGTLLEAEHVHCGGCGKRRGQT